MRTMLRKKKFWGLLALLVLAGFLWFIACRTDKNTIYIYIGPEDLCEPTGGSSKCGSVNPYNVVNLDKETKSLTITATAEAKYRVGSWILDEVEVPNSKGLPQYTLNDISANHTVKIIFEPFNVTAIPNGDLKCDEGGGPDWVCTLNYTHEINQKGFKLQFANNNIYGKDHNSCEDHVTISVDKGGSNTFVSEGKIEKYDEEADAYKNQYFCQSSSPDNAIITLSGTKDKQDDFRPIAKNFTININDATFKVTVNTTITVEQKLQLADASTPIDKFNGCGQSGTIIQRMFDCSLLVDPYHQPVKPTGISNNDNDWFVVSCPSTTSTSPPSPIQSDCAWLTPVIVSTNPVVAISQPGDKSVTGFKLKDFDQSYSKSKPRLLFSGIVRGEDKFLFNSFEANGYDIGTQTCANSSCYIDVVNPADKLPTLFPWSQIENSITTNSLCENKDAQIFPILSNSDPINLGWKIPSYPILFLLTGGGGCSDPSKYPRLCSNPADAFYAVDIAGFLKTTNPSYKKLWSSSYEALSSEPHTPDRMLLFDDGGISVGNSASTVRCVSTKWN